MFQAVRFRALAICLFAVLSGPVVSAAIPIHCLLSLQNTRIEKATSIVQVVNEQNELLRRYQIEEKDSKLRIAELTAASEKKADELLARSFKQKFFDALGGSTVKKEYDSLRDQLLIAQLQLTEAQENLRKHGQDTSSRIVLFLQGAIVKEVRSQLLEPKPAWAPNLSAKIQASSISAEPGKDMSGWAEIQAFVNDRQGRKNLKTTVKYTARFEFKADGSSHIGIYASAEDLKNSPYAFDVFKPGAVVDYEGQVILAASSVENRLADLGFLHLADLRTKLLENMHKHPVLAHQVSQVLSSLQSLKAKNGELSDEQSSLLGALVYYWANLNTPNKENMMKSAALIQAFWLPADKMKVFAAFLFGEARESRPMVERVQSQTTRMWRSSESPSGPTGTVASSDQQFFSLMWWMQINNWIVTESLNEVNRIDGSIPAEQLQNFLGTTTVDDPKFIEQASTPASPNFDPGAIIGIGGGDTGGGSPIELPTTPVETGGGWFSGGGTDTGTSGGGFSGGTD